MKLLSMTDFIISQIKTDSTVNDSFKKDLADVRNYALFLKQPLTLGMFVPCDENGNVLESPILSDSVDYFYSQRKKYFEAKEKVLFKGFERDGDCAVNKEKLIYVDEETCLLNENIEMFVSSKLELTESAIKQILG